MVDEKIALAVLGKHIREARVTAGLTQERLAELCDFDSTYVSLLERGQRNPPYLTLCNLAEQLGCSVAQLIG